MVVEIFLGAQAVDYAWSESVRDHESKSMAGGSTALDEQTLPGGRTKSGAATSVCPELRERGLTKVEEWGKLQTSLWLAREEREHRSGGENANSKRENDKMVGKDGE